MSAGTKKVGKTAASAATSPVTAEAPASPTPFVRRRIRHWKEQFDRRAPHVWARAIVTNGARVVVGQPVDATHYHWAKLRRLWEMGWIQKVTPYGTSAKGA